VFQDAVEFNMLNNPSTLMSSAVRSFVIASSSMIVMVS